MEKQLGKKTQKTLFSGFLLKKPKIVKKIAKKKWLNLEVKKNSFEWKQSFTNFLMIFSELYRN